MAVLEGWRVGGLGVGGGDGGGGGGWVLGFDQPEQTSQWGWATCMGPIPMQPAASLPQTKGREETESGEEGQQQKDREGAQRETTEMKKNLTQQGKKAGPQSIKGC